MRDYLSINWYTGCLMPYESVISFLSRFCSLNNIKLDACYSYLGLESEFFLPLSSKKISELSNLLREDLGTIQGVFAPSITLENFGVYKHKDPIYSVPLKLSYCERCIALGYHSYLHELSWMKRCPFHDQPIKELLINGPASLTRRKRLIKKFTTLMEKNAPQWPWLHREDFESLDQPILERLRQWLIDAKRQVDVLSEGEVWQSLATDSSDESRLSETIEQLHTLAPIPKLLAPYLLPVQGHWSVALIKFPKEARDDYERIVPGFGFGLILEIFIYIGAHSNNPPKFIEYLANVKHRINEIHSICKCEWWRAKANWGKHYWIRNSRGARGFYEVDAQCPYDVALDTLELGWGKASDIQWGPTADKHYCRMAKFIQELSALGIVGYTPDALVKDGHFVYYPQVDPFCEWILNSPFSDLLNAAAELEIDATGSQLLEWIDAINSGEDPRTLSMSGQSIHLCRTEEGMTLIRWRRSAFREDRALAP